MTHSFLLLLSLHSIAFHFILLQLNGKKWNGMKKEDRSEVEWKGKEK